MPPSARVFRFVPAGERIAREHVATLLSAVSDLPSGAVPDGVRLQVLRMLGEVSEPARSASPWPGGFTMISHATVGLVWNAIRALPRRDRPQAVRHAFDLVLLNMVPETGEVVLSRDQFAERMACRPAEASSALGVLVRLGVLIREVSRVKGLRGPGTVSFRINPNVAWNGHLEARAAEVARRPPPLLKLMGEAPAKVRRPSLSSV